MKNTRKLKFNRRLALDYLKGREFEDKAKPIAMAMAETLRYLGLPVNGEQLLIWVQYDCSRRRKIDRRKNGRPPLGHAAIVARIGSYGSNWYHKHIEWLDDPNTAPKYDPLAEALPRS